MALQSVDTAMLVRPELTLAIDVRPMREWIAGHIPGSIPLTYEAGPGFATRARDVLPLDAHLVLVDDHQSDLEEAAARLRGKGFEVVGKIATPSYSLATQILTPQEAEGLEKLDVGDPGQIGDHAAERIATASLWDRVPELRGGRRVAVLAGWGHYAAIGVGILEKLGLDKPAIVATRPLNETPVVAGREAFRIGGPG